MTYYPHTTRCIFPTDWPFLGLAVQTLQRWCSVGTLRAQMHHHSSDGETKGHDRQPGAPAASIDGQTQTTRLHWTSGREEPRTPGPVSRHPPLAPCSPHWVGDSWFRALCSAWAVCRHSEEMSLSSRWDRAPRALGQSRTTVWPITRDSEYMGTVLGRLGDSSEEEPR